MQSASVATYDHDAVDSIPASQLLAKPHKEGEASVGLTYASPPAFHAESVDAKDPNSMSVSSKPTTSLVSPPTSLADEMDVVRDGEALTSVESEAPTLHTPNSSSRHSSRQPRHIERFAPETTLSRASKPASRPAASTMRRITPGPGPLPASAKKPSSRPSSSHTKKSSPMVEKRFERHMASSLSPNQTSKHVKHIIDEENTDAESLRLIRELQEEEFGLRKRSTRG
jgi:F-box/leucine-rich repeat protein 10/11